MGKRTGIVLRHKETGAYYGYDLEKTKDLFKAWRWQDEAQMNVWLENSIYRPEFKDEYEPKMIIRTIEEAEE